MHALVGFLFIMAKQTCWQSFTGWLWWSYDRLTTIACRDEIIAPQDGSDPKQSYALRHLNFSQCRQHCLSRGEEPMNGMHIFHLHGVA